MSELFVDILSRCERSSHRAPLSHVGACGAGSPIPLGQAELTPQNAGQGVSEVYWWCQRLRYRWRLQRGVCELLRYNVLTSG